MQTHLMEVVSLDLNLKKVRRCLPGRRRGTRQETGILSRWSSRGKGSEAGSNVARGKESMGGAPGEVSLEKGFP